MCYEGLAQGKVDCPGGLEFFSVLHHVPSFSPRPPGGSLTKEAGGSLNFRHLGGKRLLHFGDFGELSE